MMAPINIDKKFVIALFNDGLEMVPSKWLSGDKRKCSFPNTTSAKRMKQAAKNLEEPEKSWNVYDVKKIYASSDSYKRGLRKLEKANYESDGFSSTDVERIREVIDSDDSRSAESLEKYPEVPKILMSSQNAINEIPKTPTSLSDKVQTPKSEPGWKDVMRMLGTLKYKMDILMENQDEILRRLDASPNSIRSNENVMDVVGLPDFPLQSEEDLNILEQMLKDENVKKYLVTKLKQFGGQHMSDAIRRILAYILTDELATEFSFMGLKGKRSFSALILCSVINDVVRIHFLDATNKDSGRFISTWLRHATERKNKKIKRV